MDIILVSPAAVQSSNGNFTTANRWKKILQSLGHRVDLKKTYGGKKYDLMIALHAWRSADAIQTFKRQQPGKPLIVALTGTDAYQFIHTHSQKTLKSIELADYLIGLHSLIKAKIPQQYANKCHIIFQASTLKPLRNKKITKGFNVCIAGHLRDEKDPLRAAYAARLLPYNSKIHISHYGKAHNKLWANKARIETISNYRYRWHGEISQSLLRVKFSQAKVMVLSSLMEGGANIISEAIMSDLPVIASNIDGTVGLLGKDYSGYYQVGNTQQLKTLLFRCERDEKFYNQLQHQCRTHQKLFTRHREIHSWKNLLSKVIH